MLLNVFDIFKGFVNEPIEDDKISKSSSNSSLFLIFYVFQVCLIYTLFQKVTSHILVSFSLYHKILHKAYHHSYNNHPMLDI